MSAPAISIPPRRSLALFAALAMLMVVLSYIFILLLAAACVYVPFLIVSNSAGFQTLALMIAGVIVAGSMIWSLVPRRDKFNAPGLPLTQASHPRLFAELQNIAATMNEPMPAEVYLIGDANAWVADRGGLMGFGSRRVMGLGLPLLAALNVSQFRAILAHEFGHYYGGDTKLGPWLHRTQMAMIRTFQNLGSVGSTMRVALMQVLYYIVFGILKAYWKLFLRAINFVSRKQEFRADELACIVAGPEALISGLRGLHAAASAWPSFLKTEMVPMFNMGFLPPMTTGFAQFLAAPPILQQVTKGLEKRIRDEKTQPFDSHPPLRERVAAAERLSIPSPARETELALALLDNMGNEEVRFLRVMHPDLMEKPLKPVAWEERGPVVLIPTWMKSVAAYGNMLEGMTVGNLVESLGRVPQIAPQIRDPKGMLLTPEQRIERARSLLAMGFALALVRGGAKLCSSPGEFHFELGDQQLNPFEIVTRLADGAISKAEWEERCRKLRIGNLALGLETKADVPAQ
jgi:Zn-dependent protease with chaperone function